MDESGVEYQDILPGIYCLILLKNFVGESFNVSLISGSEKSQGQEKGMEENDLPSKLFCLTVPKHSEK